LRVEFGEARLACIVEDQDGVDHGDCNSYMGPEERLRLYCELWVVGCEVIQVVIHRRRDIVKLKLMMRLPSETVG
jgi:hypothetical protein